MKTTVERIAEKRQNAMADREGVGQAVKRDEMEKKLGEKLGFVIQRGYGNEDWVVYPSGNKHPFGCDGVATKLWAECLRLMAQQEKYEAAIGFLEQDDIDVLCQGENSCENCAKFRSMLPGREIVLPKGEKE